jgi:hypothetical protein
VYAGSNPKRLRYSAIGICFASVKERVFMH